MSGKTILEYRKRVLESGKKSVDELIKVIESKIIKLDDMSDDLAADKMKNAAAAKKLAMFDALDILNRIQEEENIIKDIEEGDDEGNDGNLGFAERRAK